MKRERKNSIKTKTFSKEVEKKRNTKNNSFWCCNMVYYYEASSIRIGVWIWISAHLFFPQFTYTCDMLSCVPIAEQVDNQALFHSTDKHQNSSNDFHYAVEHLNAIYVRCIPIWMRKGEKERSCKNDWAKKLAQTPNRTEQNRNVECKARQSAVEFWSWAKLNAILCRLIERKRASLNASREEEALNKIESLAAWDRWIWRFERNWPDTPK